jgi:hypothetical protein
MDADEFIVGWTQDGFQFFFEQDDETGYLYVGNDQEITHHLHIYNRSTAFSVAEDDVRVVLNEDGSRCGVFIFGKLRGVLGFNGDSYRPADTMLGEGLTDPKWTTGFNLR